ncbi:phosphatase PAP2 family protein [Nesterenkonia marinintestina]|uniref:phosphatase PAP2 family protein n=1 Tax=Nesterenkonia marinintestina TaxID=2979865 RepID=UPI0021BEBC87|nr:phosphatase PAP2 family protein [Nesterenkonia sp. GX14115]
MSAALLLALGLGTVWALREGGGRSSLVAQAAIDLEATTEAHHTSEVTLISLVVLWCALAAWLLMRRLSSPLARLAAGGLGAVIAYALSEAAKALIAADRPCRAYAVEVATCPGAESMAYPSNHTVIAVALAAAVVASAPRWAWAAAPLAAATGAGRVLAGHHYPHDVVAGAGLGLTVVIAAVLIASPPLRRTVIVPLTGEEPRRRIEESEPRGEDAPSASACG